MSLAACADTSTPNRMQQQPTYGSTQEDRFVTARGGSSGDVSAPIVRGTGQTTGGRGGGRRSRPATRGRTFARADVAHGSCLVVCLSGGQRYAPAAGPAIHFSPPARSAVPDVGVTAGGATASESAMTIALRSSWAAVGADQASAALAETG
jgi:hypothetical protein